MVAFLLEVGTEELPASFVDSAMAQWQDRIPTVLAELDLAVESVQVYGTPRRLAVLILGLPSRQPDRIQAVKGPSVQVAFQNGSLSPAAIGFAKKQGVDPATLETRDTDKGSFVFAVQRLQGQATAQLLTDLAPGWITGLTGERLMRWGNGDLKFPRPIRWLVALLDDQVLPLELEGIRSDRWTRVHRVLHPEPLRLAQAQDYATRLLEGYVQPNRQKRQELIHAGIQTTAATVEGIADIPEALLKEVTQLVEWPTPILGRFDPEFLELPAPVIKIVMVTHQRYFPIHHPDHSDQLLPCFVTIGNGDPARSDLISAGNSRVVRARLADARFFYREDQKTSLEHKVDALAKVTFVEELGSMRDKVDRIEQISALLAERLQLSAGDRASVQRTALLCKADLVTQMVYEFPELQGVMGADYALRGGEDPAVANGIEQHYWPLGSGNRLPQVLTGQVVGLADRLDTLVGLFKLGRIPSGSSDRFGLRRAANAIVNIIWAAGWSLNLAEVLNRLVYTYGQDQGQDSGVSSPLDLLQTFFLQRIQTLLIEDKGIDYDLVNAVLGDIEASPPDPELGERALRDLNDTLTRAEYLQELRQAGTLAALYPTLNRSARLAQQGTLSTSVMDPAQVVDTQLLTDPAEQDLYQACRTLYQQGVVAQSTRDYRLLVQAFLEAAPVVSHFFDTVLVMDKDPNLKANRLNLLGILRNNARLLADFSAVVIAGESTTA